jgi:hypothetical protein
VTDDAEKSGNGADDPPSEPASASPATKLSESPVVPQPTASDDAWDALPDGDEANVEGPSAPTIFVTDPTVEAARVEWALRARGYEVIDVPLAMLAGRVAVQRPHLVLLDVDAPGALEIAARVRQLPGAGGVHLIYAGVAGKTFDSTKDAYAHEGSGFFPRPIDIDALVGKIDSLLGLENQPDNTSSVARRSSRPPPPPPSLRGPPPQSQGPLSPLPPRPEGPASLRLPSEPPSEGASESSRNGPPKGWSARAAEQRLSPDLERLLREAEARVVGPTSQRSPDSIPTSDDELLSPEDEVEAVLPAEILASLDEPLDIELDDDDAGSSETGGTGGGTPHHATTGRGIDPAAKTGVGREQTHGGDVEAASLTTSAGRRVIPPSSGTAAGTMRNRDGGTHEGTGVEPLIVPEPNAPPPVARDISTPRPPRRQMAAPPEPPPQQQPEEEEQERNDEVSQHYVAPMPAMDHPPPLAPQTSRPPAMRDQPAPPQPQPQQVIPQPRAITSSDEALRALSSGVATRLTGVLRFDEAAGIRRIVMQDGDIVTAASSVEGESLLGYLVSRGDLAADVAKRLEGRVPPFGRLAGAALVAHGHLHQDQLWDVLQAHAAWLLTRTIAIPRGRVAFEAEPPQRLRGEPPVFGGTPGPALILEIVRRAVTPPEATARLGGLDARFTPGEHQKLLDECGLDDDDDALLRHASGVTLREIVDQRGEEAPPLLYALVALGVLQTLIGIRPGAMPSAQPEAEIADPLRDAELDDGAVRARITARRALVEDGDYFAILGVPREATGYEIKRAYLDLRRALDPARVMRPSLLDVADDLKLVLGVLDEAYDVLKDPTRRERYRRAISGMPALTR